MKFELNHNPEHKAFSLPYAAVKLAELEKAEHLSAHVEPNLILLLPKGMTAGQTAAAAGALSDLACELTARLAKACGSCEDCGFCENEDAEICGDCEHPCEGLSIPPCVLEKAEIPRCAALDIKAAAGKLIITAAEERHDPIDDLPEVVANTLLASGVCMANLRDILESGEPIDE